MTRERFPGDVEFRSDRRESLLGFLISIGIVLLLVGVMLLVIAAIPEFAYQTTNLPPDVQAVVDSTRTTSVALLTVGGGLVAIGLIERL